MLSGSVGFLDRFLASTHTSILTDYKSFPISLTRDSANLSPAAHLKESPLNYHTTNPQVSYPVAQLPILMAASRRKMLKTTSPGNAL